MLAVLLGQRVCLMIRQTWMVTCTGCGSLSGSHICTGVNRTSMRWLI